MHPADGGRGKGNYEDQHKQLPLRPQAVKPVLTKFDSFSRPAPLYSQGASRTQDTTSPSNLVTSQSTGIYPANLMAYRPHKQNPAVSGTQNLGYAPTMTSGGHRNIPSSHGAVGSAGMGMNSIPSTQSALSPAGSYVRSHANPYTRPISAKDMMDHSGPERASRKDLRGHIILRNRQVSEAHGSAAAGLRADGAALSGSARSDSREPRASKTGGAGGDRATPAPRANGTTTSSGGSRSRVDGILNSGRSDALEKENKQTGREQQQVFCSSGGKPLSAANLGKSILHRDFMPPSEPLGKKMPVTNTTITRPGYYPNLAKTMMYEQRPRAEGAPAKSKSLESRTMRPHLPSARQRLTSLDTDESEEDDDDDDLPSGERLPGDGAASLDDLDEEDDGIDCLEDDVCSTDGDREDVSSSGTVTDADVSGDLDSMSFASSTVSRQSSGHSQLPCPDLKPKSAAGDIVPALCPSLFPKVPPTINFAPEGAIVEHLPWEVRKFLKWRLSPITPNIVKAVVARAGFTTTKRNDWLGCWGKHMKSIGFKAIREFQKLNHFPGSFVIGRKDRLWRNLSRMQVLFGKKEYGFFPQTFVLPPDLKLLKRAFEDGGGKQKWIIKPPASARGIGIRVIHKWNQVPRKKPVVVQKYLARPYLINESKFDMRVYVYISCFDPLRLYIYEDGLARFASCKYSPSLKSLNNKFMHLTNYSVNKKNADYQSNGDENGTNGHKWSLKALWSYMKRQGVNTTAIWDSIKDLVVKTILSAESSINSYIKSNVRSRYSVHELFGFDILLDDRLRPWILEVNISPSLHSNSPLDVKVKGGMVRDLLNMAGIRIPEKGDLSQHGQNNTFVFATYQPANDYCMDKRLYTNQLSPDERAKHAYFCQRYQDEHALTRLPLTELAISRKRNKQILQTVLDVLTPDDTRVLIECIDEDSRKGGFQRIFPTPSSHTYLRFFETPRYYNLLLDQWVQRYNRMEARGIALLESICEKGVHLQNPTNDPAHQWCPPRSPFLLNLRDRDPHATPRVTDARQRSAPASKHLHQHEEDRERGNPRPGVVHGGVLKMGTTGTSKERAAKSLPSRSLQNSDSGSSNPHTPLGETPNSSMVLSPSFHSRATHGPNGHRIVPRGPATLVDR